MAVCLMPARDRLLSNVGILEVTGLQVMATTASTFSKVMSSLQDRYKATHLHEEGDALLLAFLDPVDAVCWCLATQKVRCS